MQSVLSCGPGCPLLLTFVNLSCDDVRALGGILEGQGSPGTHKDTTQCLDTVVHPSLDSLNKQYVMVLSPSEFSVICL